MQEEEYRAGKAGEEQGEVGEARGAWAGRGRGPLKVLETGHGEKNGHREARRSNDLLHSMSWTQKGRVFRGEFGWQMDLVLAHWGQRDWPSWEHEG